MRITATDLELDKFWTGNNKYGKRVKRRLRFSKSGNEDIEKANAT